jgi:tRNA-specific 2-thiouridylase
VTVGTREQLATHTVTLRDAVLYRPRFDRVRLRYRQLPLACTPRHTDGGGLELALAAPAYGVAPGQLACLMDGELIVGHATIARPAARTTTSAPSDPGEQPRPR